MATACGDSVHKEGTSYDWDIANPTLSASEIGYESDTGLYKVGDGSTAWRALSYWPKSRVPSMLSASAANIYYIKAASITADQIISYEEYTGGLVATYSTDANAWAIGRTGVWSPAILSGGNVVGENLSSSTITTFQDFGISKIDGTVTSPWTPASFGDALQAWWKSSAGITKDGSNVVTEWQDQSAHGNHLTAGALGPVWKANQLGTIPSLSSDGTRWMGTTLFSQGHIASPFFVWAIARTNAFPPAGNNYQIFAGTAAGDDASLYLHTDASSACSISYFNGVEVYTGVTPNKSWHYWLGEMSGSTSDLYVSRHLSGYSGNVGTDGMSGINLFTTWVTSPGLYSLWRGDIIELGICSGDIVAADRTNLRNYIHKTYRLALDDNTIIADIQLHRGLSADWSSEDPILSAGEFGWESDIHGAKIGDGSTAWTSLPYFPSWTDNLSATNISATGLTGNTVEGSVICGTTVASAANVAVTYTGGGSACLSGGSQVTSADRFLQITIDGQVFYIPAFASAGAFTAV